MRRAFSVLAVPFIAGAALCACSLLVDSSGLVGGADPSRDGSPLDTGGSVDGPADGPSDSAPAADSDASPPCVDGAGRFCDDFDDTNPGAKWTDRNTRRGQLAYDDGSLSPPHALHATVSAGGGPGEAVLTETFASAPSKIRCALDVKLDETPGSGELNFLELATSGAGATHYIYVTLSNGKWSVAEYHEAPDGGVLVDRRAELGVALPLRTWFHVVLDTSQTSATLTANGTSATLTSLAIPAGTARELKAGITYVSSSVQSASVFIDNVDCTMQP